MFSFTISWFTCDSSGPSAAKCMQEGEKKRKEKVHTLAHTLSPFGMTHFQVAMRLIPARAHMCKNIPDPGGAVHFFAPPPPHPLPDHKETFVFCPVALLMHKLRCWTASPVGLQWGKLTTCNPEEGSGCLTAPWVPRMMRESCWHVKPQ